jgi:hypothetical protein
VCPQDCVCNENGCVSCINATNRVVYRTKSKAGNVLYICDCLPPLDYKYNGYCVCLDNCTCVNGNITCDAASNRFQTYDGDWQCLPPYSDVNGTC